ncbi:AAA family ATPase [Streptomyces sp. NPDC059176]|uniref:AAA family ATPase n=1 Tax=unclassified Streptomyces TaxID=2593676 RepID=UPI0036C2C464
MRLHRLAVTAFGPFGGRQDVDFDALSAGGLFLLHGPTGAGKTSVLDAVCFALYGAVPGARQSPAASLRSDHAATSTFTEVSLELTVSGRRLEITRRPAQPRPKKKGKGFTTEKAQSWLREFDPVHREWQALSRSHQEIGEEITELVGMSRDQFCQVVLLPQGDFARFLRADAEARAKLLGRLFDTRRFAAVEERLGELRRAAEQQVREGDERLLAVVHRMVQAAGPVAEEHPAPDGRPGEPGLTDAVLEWAAVVRTGAREFLDVADSAASAAEGRREAAGHALDLQRERAALQHRYADARRRAEESETRRPERDRAQDLLDRARQAELVGPALRFHEDADREHRAAVALCGELRADLPAALAEAGAEQLAALERGLRTDLGGLDAARRAERRCAELAGERADVDRQGREDDVILRDTEGWLAGWEALRRALKDRIDAAQDAATRAENLAGRLPPARRRADAAAERDRLVDRAATTEDELRRARDRAGSARDDWLDLKERRLRGIAAELAAGLLPGEPCAVCGSVEHPSPAEADDSHVDRAREDAAYEAYTLADAVRADAERELAVVHEAFTAARRAAKEEPATRVSEALLLADGAQQQAPRGTAPTLRTPADLGGAAPAAPAAAPVAGSSSTATATGGAEGDGVLRGPSVPGQASPPDDALPHGTGLSQQLGGPRSFSLGADDPDARDLAAAVARLEQEHAQAHARASGMHAAREELQQAEREHEERIAARQEAERRVAARTSHREALDREQALLEAEVARVVGDAGSVGERAIVLERRIELLAAAAEAVRTAESTAERLKEADGRLADAVSRAGFDTPSAAAAALLSEAEQSALRHEIDAWQAEAAAVADRLAEPDTRAAAGQAPADPATAEHAHDAAERTLRDATAGLAAAHDRCAQLGRLSRQALAEARRLGPLRDAYDRVARLAGLTAGTSSENDRRMRLESYVLAARLEQVAAAATARLQRMSSGRYTLVHSDARAGGKRSGLGLHVVDAWTGRERDTATLSGGETFFASLALALGLADVVTEEAGGVRLDTLFIDEGFGSLDDQTLDEVLDVLDALRERDRSVGIVSHVADLRRRIPAQLEVVKERHGSAVRLRAAPLGG